MQAIQTISPADLVPMDLFAGDVPLRIDIAYTQPQPKSFCGVIYRPAARLWLHRDLAALVVCAAREAEKAGYGLILYDGLRTTEAQALMRETPVVRANPQWLEGATRMLSPPGKGAHPRGMAIDLTLCDAAGNVLDMGTAFDAMPPGGAGPGPETNPAHRDSAQDDTARANRALLTRFMDAAARAVGHELLPLPQEWWDYRFPAAAYDVYAPLSDADLPQQMRMTDVVKAAPKMPDFGPDHFAVLRRDILRRAGIPAV